jgi:hypothetical protein
MPDDASGIPLGSLPRDLQAQPPLLSLLQRLGGAAPAQQQAYRLAQYGLDTGPAVSAAYTQDPSALANSAYRLATMPARGALAAGNFIGDTADTVMHTDPIDHETGNFSIPAIETSTRLAMSMAAPGTMFRAAPAGSVGMFAGPKALTADRNMLDMAQEMAAKGVPREEIWPATGWYRGVDGNWKHEIPDTGLRVIPGTGAGISGMDSVIQHPALAAAYPQFKNMVSDVKLVGKNPGGLFDGGVNVRATDPNMMRWVTAHELQHPIQQIEGFESGTGMRGYAEEARKILGPGASDDAVRGLTHIAYMRNAAEVEARNVEARLWMTPQERMAKPPWLTQDVPDELQTLSPARATTR